MSEDNLTFGEEKYQIKPTPGRLAIRIQDIERETKSGLVLLSDSHAPKPTVGTVFAVSDEYEQDGEDFDPLYKVGDVVVFGKYTGTKVRVGDVVVIVLRENDILCRLVPSDAPDAITARKVKINDRNE